jgi:hypothetical protein
MNVMLGQLFSVEIRASECKHKSFEISGYQECISGGSPRIKQNILDLPYNSLGQNH